MSQVGFMDLSQANHLEHMCDELFSSIKNEKNESFWFEDDQTVSDEVWLQILVDS